MFQVSFRTEINIIVLILSSLRFLWPGVTNRGTAEKTIESLYVQQLVSECCTRMGGRVLVAVILPIGTLAFSDSGTFFTWFTTWTDMSCTFHSASLLLDVDSEQGDQALSFAKSIGEGLSRTIRKSDVLNQLNWLDPTGFLPQLYSIISIPPPFLLGRWRLPNSTNASMYTCRLKTSLDRSSLSWKPISSLFGKKKQRSLGCASHGHRGWNGGTSVSPTSSSGVYQTMNLFRNIGCGSFWGKCIRDYKL